jgi:hypothetical protein
VPQGLVKQLGPLEKNIYLMWSDGVYWNEATKIWGFKEVDSEDHRHMDGSMYQLPYLEGMMFSVYQLFLW